MIWIDAEPKLEDVDVLGNRMTFTGVDKVVDDLVMLATLLRSSSRLKYTTMRARTESVPVMSWL